MMMDGWWHGAWWIGMMGLGMLLVLLLFLAIIIGGLYLVVRAFRVDNGRGAIDRGRVTPRSNALSILEDRFARGEIDREEFEERRRTLLGG